MNLKFTNFLLLLLLNVQFTLSYKILIHSDLGGMSHVKYLFEIVSYMNRHHEHAVYFSSTSSNSKFISNYNMTFVDLGPVDLSSLHLAFKGLIGRREPIDFLKSLGPILSQGHSEIYEHSFAPLSKLVLSVEPDVIICDFFAPVCRDVANKYNIPLINGFQTIDSFNLIPMDHITRRTEYYPITTENLSLSERIYDKVMLPLRQLVYFYSMIFKLNKLRRKFNVPITMNPMGNFDRDLALVNTFLGFEPATNIPTNVKLVGPILGTKKDNLGEDLQQFLKFRSRVVYVGFGSMIYLADFDIANLVNGLNKMLNANVINGVIWGLGRTPVDLFEAVKPDGDNGSEIPINFKANPNVKLLNWAPQNSLLNHPNVQVFISHCGLESSLESIFASTPILCLPFTTDQPRNARKLVDLGVAKYLNRITMTSDTVAETLNEILFDVENSYQLNLKRINLITEGKDSNFQKVDELITNFIKLTKLCRTHTNIKPHKTQIKCEVQHLVPKASQMNFITKNHIDIYFLAFTMLLTLSIGFGYLSFYLTRRVASEFKSQTKTKLN